MTPQTNHEDEILHEIAELIRGDTQAVTGDTSTAERCLRVYARDGDYPMSDIQRELQAASEERNANPTDGTRPDHTARWQTALSSTAQRVVQAAFQDAERSRDRNEAVGLMRKAINMGAGLYAHHRGWKHRNQEHLDGALAK